MRVRASNRADLARASTLVPNAWGKTMKTLLLVTVAVGCMVGALPGCDRSDTQVSQKTVELYGTHCARCHEVGAANAPRNGDTKAWAKRLKKGEDALITSVKEGLVAMPKMGDCASCTDDDFRQLIQYMSR